MTRVLVENSPRQSFSNACTQGLLSVKTHDHLLDCRIYGEKCFTDAVILRASTSHGIQVVCLLRSFALKNPANRGLLLPLVT